MQLARHADVGWRGRVSAMTEKLTGMSPLEQAAKKTITPAEAERAAVRQLASLLGNVMRTSPARTGC